MNNIVLVMNNNRMKTIFTEQDINNLRKLGNISINDECANPDRDRMKLLIRDANIVITSWGCCKFDIDILDASPNLKLIAHAAGSVKGIISDEVWKRGIRVTSSAKALGIGVAETALGFTIASLKNMWQLSQNTKKGEWNLGKENIKEVYGLNIGVIGAGRAGRHYIKLMQNFDVNILLYDPVVTESDAQQMGVHKMELEELLRKSDVVSIHAPSIPETYRMLNSETLALMKDDAILINTARGSIIDENALIGELKKGRLFACLDVTDPEPPAKDHPFRSLSNVILTPHIAGAVNNGLYRIGSYIVDEIRCFQEGRQMDGEVLQRDLKTLA